MMKVLRTFLKKISNFLGNSFCYFIKFYQKCISPLHRPCCRFTPTCSAYALEAIQKYGPAKGLFLAFKRILRCNPFCKGGYDPVP